MSVARAMPDKCGLDRTRAIPQQTSPPGLLDDRLGLAQSFLEGRNPTALRRRVIKASSSLHRLHHLMKAVCWRQRPLAIRVEARRRCGGAARDSSVAAGLGPARVLPPRGYRRSERQLP